MSLDTNQTDYRNEGHSFKWHCNSYEIVFYDKIKDLEKAKQSEKRAIEKDNTIQLELFSKLRKKKKLEVLRMEVRLSKRSKMKQLFAKLGIKSDLSLESLFKPAISKKVLLHYLDELDRARLPILDYKADNDKSLLTEIIINNPTMSSKKAMQIYGLLKALEVMSMRELRSLLSKKNPKDWYRLIKEAKEVRLEKFKYSFNFFREQLAKSNLSRIKK